MTEKSNLTPAMVQYMELKKAHQDYLLFYRMGDFYELFFEDAINVSHELELTLTGKNAGLEERIPMCGIPYHAINVYLEKLVENGHKVGICEQLEDPKEAKGVVKRGLTKIVSRGTIIDESLIETENNYIGALIDFEHIYALSYIDLSTGEVNVTLVNHDISSIISEIVNIGIKELIMSHRTDTDKLNAQIEEMKNTIDGLRDDQEKLLKINAELKAEINCQNESLERAKKEIKFHVREKNKIEKDSEILHKDLSELRVQNEKMHRLTHGKFKRQKSTDK